MKTIMNKINRPLWIILLSLSFITIEILFLFVLGPELKLVSGQKMMDMIQYTGDEFYHVLDLYGDKGLEIYNKMQCLDMFFIVIYGLLLTLCLYNLKFKYYQLPIFVAVFDLLENLGIRYLIWWPISSGPNFVYVFSALKFIGFVLSLILIIVLWIKSKFKSDKSFK